LREQNGEHAIAVAEGGERCREIREALCARIGEDAKEAVPFAGRTQPEGTQRVGRRIHQTRPDVEHEVGGQLVELAPADAVGVLHEIRRCDRHLVQPVAPEVDARAAGVLDADQDAGDARDQGLGPARWLPGSDESDLVGPEALACEQIPPSDGRRVRVCRVVLGEVAAGVALRVGADGGRREREYGEQEHGSELVLVHGRKWEPPPEGGGSVSSSSKRALAARGVPLAACDQ
jgi:hypothetical protein